MVLPFLVAVVFHELAVDMEVPRSGLDNPLDTRQSFLLLLCSCNVILGRRIGNPRTVVLC